jgi:hypothetical protein
MATKNSDRLFLRIQQQLRSLKLDATFVVAAPAVTLSILTQNARSFARIREGPELPNEFGDIFGVRERQSVQQNWEAVVH